MWVTLCHWPSFAPSLAGLLLGLDRLHQPISNLAPGILLPRHLLLLALSWKENHYRLGYLWQQACWGAAFLHSQTPILSSHARGCPTSSWEGAPTIIRLLLAGSAPHDADCFWTCGHEFKLLWETVDPKATSICSLIGLIQSDSGSSQYVWVIRAHRHWATFCTKFLL